MQEELAKMTATEGQTAGALKTAQQELTNITNEVKGLRDTVREAQKDVDSQFDSVVKLTDEINQMRRVKADLENRQRPLQDELAAAAERWASWESRVGRREGALFHTDVDRIPPKVFGCGRQRG